jgi:enoyl-CoA hydratase
MRRELPEVLTRLRGDDTVRAVVVTGAGDKAFSAGADIREFLEPPVPTQFREARRRVDFRREMERCPQPIIAAIRGYAFGAACDGARCDIRIAAEDAQLGLTEINLAIIPGGGGTQRLPRLVGRGKALEMIMTGMRIPAAEALRIGLIERVVPVAELPSAAQALARTLADKAPVALRYAKEAVVGGLACRSKTASVSRTIRHAAAHHRGPRRGRRAFVEKRKPR